MKKLPKKFEMCTKYARADKYIVKLNNHGAYDLYRPPTSIDDAFDPPVGVYTEKFVQDAVDWGTWEITKDMDEPELVFPFRIAHSETGNMYKVVAGSQEGRATMMSNEHTYENIISFDDCKRYIEDGTWIVKSVGEQRGNVHLALKIEESIWSDDEAALAVRDSGYGIPLNGDTVTLYCNENRYADSRKFNDGWWQPLGASISVGAIDCSFTGDKIEAKGLKIKDAAGNVVVASPTEPLSIKVDTTQITEALKEVKALAQAYEDLCISMESYMKLREEIFSKEMKNYF